jgi:ABC-2 type transport system ATP-binding protein
MGQPDIVIANHLVKRYGSRLALRGVSFSIAQGEIIGLLGPNGSGKSTILRILTGYLPPSGGSIRVGGHDAWEQPLEIRRYVGYVPEDAPLYDVMRVSEFLRFMAEIKGVPAHGIAAAVASVCSRLDLRDVVKMTIGKLSRGYRQRVAIAQALLNDPPLLVLDEPTNALDANQVIGVRELIRGLGGKQTVIVASHVLTEIERLATRVMILREGELLTADAMAEQRDRPRLRLHIAGPPDAVLSMLRRIPGVIRADTVPEADESAGGPRVFLAEISHPSVAEEVARATVEHGFALSGLAEEKADLERVFLDLTRRATQAEAA